MQTTEEIYARYLTILKRHLVPAMGCTEPVAIAYAAAKVRDVLGQVPERIHICVSRNILKNVKSVIVPNTDGLKGIQAAVAAGIVAGRSEKKLEVIATVQEEQKKKMRSYMESHDITVGAAAEDILFFIDITAYGNETKAHLVISGSHTNIVLIEKDGEILFQKEEKEEEDVPQDVPENLLTVKKIREFADVVRTEDIEGLVGRQIDYNMKIAKMGLEKRYGANIGKVILNHGEKTSLTYARAAAAAASDARMGGCELPVIIISGSGNQGISASVPIATYGEREGYSREQILRAVALSDLLTIHLKNGIGYLSAYCGAVCAGCAAGAGLAYLCGGGDAEIAHTLVNSLAIVSGMICDGAKPSCASKIAFSVEAGIHGYQMYQDGQQFYCGDGIVPGNVELMIDNIGRLGNQGMRQTDKEIIDMMLQ
ncbi:MAG: L-serine ammonia-lyase, iron-sulfur-dependent, subunit alpha [Eubacteriales bacterium]|nr:L-serine ammonia-lyase, iron-sulfur-dependent, subunit alpha [Eubacteriales bacterium]